MKAWLSLLLVLLLGGTVLKAEDDAAAHDLLKQMLAAQASKNYDAFIAHGTTALKAALTRTQFDAASDMINARCRAGYDLTLLGEVNQSGHEVYLFRIRCQDGGDDILATLSLKGGQVGGIFFH